MTIASRGTAGAWLDARMAEWDRLHPQAGGAAWSRVEKPGVTIRYAQGLGTLPRIALQMPGFVRSIAAERNWTTAFAAQHGVTHVFSDNCYGARAELPGVTNVFLSHQLNPPVPAAVRGGPRLSFAGMRKPLTKCGSPTRTVSSPVDWHTPSAPPPATSAP